MFIRTENFSQYVRAYPIVTFLLALNIGIFILTWIPGIGNQLLLFGIGDNFLIANGEYWRLVTPMFLHGGLTHLLFNMFSLFIFGPELEKIAGKARFITIYMLAGLFGDVATYFLQSGDYRHLGASGAIFGVFGAFGALVYYTKHVFPQLKQVILPIIVISVVMTFVGTNINVTAHIAGLITGFLIGLSYFNPKNIVSWRKKR
ncbi:MULTISPECIES: rhomboid family intramembrane serine protease [Sporosarcina]|uniref:Rhomboid protease GluP n=2 Tax=Sporosarcina newyorkensis TaxID=759851 RepID=A0A1T4YPN0_9BACL|nr:MULTISPECIES: rhomboid family intramembrane serine protease [Sporosarcina]EGQ25099.1 S54 family unassigned serine peptidase [Sporosarcina newyorkensis 2681]MBY0222181.1 rhomboid family intramembrane serine protease [Sporosarcina aquimarina]SKB03221.1 rhomboid protease GluP [Sporosarcina newyorkensis]